MYQDEIPNFENYDVVLDKVVCYNNDVLTTKFLDPKNKLPLANSEKGVCIYDSLSFSKKESRRLKLSTMKFRNKSQVKERSLCFEIENTQMKIFKDSKSHAFVLLFCDNHRVKNKTSVHIHLRVKVAKKNGPTNKRKTTIKCGKRFPTKKVEMITNNLIKNLRRKHNLLDKGFMHVLLKKNKKNHIHKQQSLHCFLKKTLKTNLGLEMYPYSPSPHNEVILVGAVLRGEGEHKFIVTRHIRSQREVYGFVQWLSNFCYHRHMKNCSRHVQNEIRNCHLNLEAVKAIVTVTPRKKHIYFHVTDQLLDKFFINSFDYIDKTFKINNKTFISARFLGLKLHSLRIYVENMDSPSPSLKLEAKISALRTKLSGLLADNTKDSNTAAQNLIDMLSELRDFKNKYALEFLDCVINIIKREICNCYYHTSEVKIELENFFDYVSHNDDLLRVLEGAIKFDRSLKAFKLKKYQNFQEGPLSKEVNTIHQKINNLLENENIQDTDGLKKPSTIFDSIKDFSKELRDAYKNDFHNKTLENDVTNEKDITEDLAGLGDALNSLVSLYHKDGDANSSESVDNRDADGVRSIILNKIITLKKKLRDMQNIDLNNTLFLQKKTGCCYDGDNKNLMARECSAHTNLRKYPSTKTLSRNVRNPSKIGKNFYKITKDDNRIIRHDFRINRHDSRIISHDFRINRHKMKDSIIHKDEQIINKKDSIISTDSNINKNRTARKDEFKISKVESNCSKVRKLKPNSKSILTENKRTNSVKSLPNRKMLELLLISQKRNSMSRSSSSSISNLKGLSKLMNSNKTPLSDNKKSKVVDEIIKCTMDKQNKTQTAKKEILFPSTVRKEVSLKVAMEVKNDVNIKKFNSLVGNNYQSPNTRATSPKPETNVTENLKNFLHSPAIRAIPTKMSCVVKKSSRSSSRVSSIMSNSKREVVIKLPAKSREFPKINESFPVKTTKTASMRIKMHMRQSKSLNYTSSSINNTRKQTELTKYSNPQQTKLKSVLKKSASKPAKSASVIESFTKPLVNTNFVPKQINSNKISKNKKTSDKIKAMHNLKTTGCSLGSMRDKERAQIKLIQNKNYINRISSCPMNSTKSKRKSLCIVHDAMKMYTDALKQNKTVSRPKSKKKNLNFRFDSSNHCSLKNDLLGRVLWKRIHKLNLC